jgi:Na+-transporting NADH:ubiquinone oxidoreductase subunit C
MFSNRYIFIYASVLVVLVAIILTIAAVQLKPFQDNNKRVEKMQNILSSLNIESTPQNAKTLYEKTIVNTMVINNKGEVIPKMNAFDIDLYYELKKAPEARNLPVYVAKLDNGDTLYVTQVRGKGLWGPIWGFISFKTDMNTIFGAYFDHKGETPGLGAEIDTKKFQNQFKEKKIFDESGKFTSVKTIKGGAKPGDIHGVDAISGGTITSNGVTDMLRDCLLDYQNFFNKNRK